MKYKGAVLAALILGIYTWFIWPEKPIETTSTAVGTNKEAKASSEKVSPRVPDRDASKKIVKHISHKDEVKPVIERKDPGVILDHKLKNAQEVIEGKGYGTFPPVDLKDMNEHKKHVLDALQDPKNNSGSISIVGKRERFDPERYKEDSSYYLNSVEPGRAFDSAQAGPDVKKLERVGYASIQTVQNKKVTLEAKGISGMPISFTVFDGGHFQNGLSYITLKADASGVAKAEFTPTDGVINQTRIRAASPVNSGTLQWNVFVHLNNQEANN